MAGKITIIYLNCWKLKEGILLVSSKFRKSEIGRVGLDILRSLIMTARAAEVSPRAYLSWALAQPENDREKNPHLYTPLAYRTLHLAAFSSQGVDRLAALADLSGC